MSDPKNMSSHDEDLEILPLELSPLDGWHRAHNAEMSESATYDMPVHYGDSVTETAWVRDHAGLMDVSHMGQLALMGDGVEQALSDAAGLDIATIDVGQVVALAVRDRDEDLSADVAVMRRADDLFIVAGAADKYDLSAWLFGVLPDDATVNLMDGQALIALVGPRAGAALATAVDGVAAIGSAQAAPLGWNGHDLWIMRTDDGYEVSISGDDAAEFADALCKVEGVKPVGLSAASSLKKAKLYRP